MKINKKGLDLIKNFESLQLKAYKCPAGVWTIGYGHTKNVNYADVVTKEQAEEMLKEDVKWAEDAVEKYITSNLNENQFSALVSFVFNCGTTNFKNSTLRKVVNADPNNMGEIQKQFMRWCYAKKNRLNGLVRRRTAEFSLYSDEVM